MEAQVQEWSTCVCVWGEGCEEEERSAWPPLPLSTPTHIHLCTCEGINSLIRMPSGAQSTAPKTPTCSTEKPRRSFREWGSDKQWLCVRGREKFALDAKMVRSTFLLKVENKSLDCTCCFFSYTNEIITRCSPYVDIPNLYVLHR